MMNYLIGLVALLTLSTPSGGSFYNISFTGLDGSTISTSVYKGKKVVVFAFNGVHPDLGLLSNMDSVQRAGGDSIQVVGIPALDFDSTVSTQRVAQLRDSMGLAMTLGNPVHVGKSTGSAQSALFQWLTSAAQNGHFNRDVEEPGMLFIVSTSGELYGIINNALRQQLLSQVLLKQPGQ